MATYRQVKNGSRGEDVKTLQKLLNQRGYSLAEDGVFGKNTESAVRDYQSRNGLSADGIAGPNTWGALTAPTAAEEAAILPDPQKNAALGGSPQSAAAGLSGIPSGLADALAGASARPSYAQDPSVGSALGALTAWEQAGDRTGEPARPGSYTVVKGDCLWTIAKRFYGSGESWRTLYEANRAVVGANPNLIYPGQVLTIP